MPFPFPRLWVVAVTLGNPGDFTPRARQVLQEADLILAEDTRRAGLFFQRHDVAQRGTLRSFFEHNENERIPAVLNALEQGRNVALISDAGTPLIGDPGYRLVRACRNEGYVVTPVPGPCAPVAALSASGLPPSPFSFLGFLPRQTGEQKRLFLTWAEMTTTLVFFERNSRLPATLGVALDCLGPREICVARELTKEHEEFILGRLETHQDMRWDPRGEVTVIIGPPEFSVKTLEEDMDRMLLEEMHSGTPRDVASRIAARTRGWTSKEVYARLISISKANPGSRGT
ncbi:16S rRNA (cytidine1402-2'-O)-methyltransferase [Desulfonatronum thiosulfatophilum]|uniref:Ribosomal RNA small subunit methyltransferase I n=1 Tax=Desulfonatronum thiosulfatophilum TaxID=617002 RepID=A0A1G6AL75_9BACT|nr:16S rRNA (cytidine(1402)-2'-O)-methyltransferase [Desulfonatronum thiosulfatophilum]SDB09154.1 16S rRNA (cytidine1402-2'-O)-methyltransferase [Desulfonatronum thiosulfatophilum]